MCFARFPWETALKVHGAQENKLISKNSLLKAQEWHAESHRGMAESQGERTGNSCLSSNAEVLRWSKLKEVMQKQYGEAAQAEELKLGKDASNNNKKCFQS